MIPVRGYKERKVAVLGLGRSGLATAHALRAGGVVPVCWDDAEAARQSALDEGFGVEDLSRDKPWDGVAALIVSPGIAHLYPAPHPVVLAAQAHGAVLDNDVGLFFRSFATETWSEMDNPPRIICVTGSNGKSTTTALIHHILSNAGRNVQMGGNIGRGVLDLEPGEDGDVIVLELSSFQIELARALAPDVAVFTNLSPDHLDRHGGMGGYFAAKRRLFAEGGPDRAVVGVDQPEGQFLAMQLRERERDGDPVIRVATSRLSGEGWNVFARKGWLAEWRKGRQVASFDMRSFAGLPGVHNHQNACHAYAACRSIGLPPRQIEAAMTDFGGLRHRCQYLGARDGVQFINDSKATNADAAEQALKAFERIRWIVGGVPKAGGIAPLLPHMDRVLKSYLIGQAADAFSQTLADHPQQISATLEQAFRQAVAEASAGDTILLAPACSSHDQFENFEARGEAFEALVSTHLRSES